MGRTTSRNAFARRGGNDGLMESMGDRTMKLSCLPPFPQTLEISRRAADFTHSAPRRGRLYTDISNGLITLSFLSGTNIVPLPS